jgi:hypothetical protein
MINSLISYLSRIFFAFALLIVLVAVWDRIIRLFGWTLSWMTYQPGRLLEISAVLVIFIIAILLRQIRDELRKQ